MTREFDVTVVGAGPAGCAAAITLARHGRRVLLVDRASFPRDKCCGGGLTTAAVRRLEALGLDPGQVASFRPTAELAVRSPSGRTVRLPFDRAPGVFAAVARRSQLDLALLELARRRGVEILEGTRCVGVAELPDGALRLAFDGGREARAPYVIAADGAWSPIRRMLAPREAASGPERLTARQADWIAFRAYVAGVRPSATERLWVWFDADLLPGYGWSFPLADHTVNLGVCLPRRPGRNLAARWDSALKSPFVQSLVGPAATLEAPARAWPIPTGIDRVELTGLGGRVLFAGDAACAADPFTGEGISQALATGALAAEAIAEAAPSPGTVAHRYRDRVRGSIGRDHRLSRGCRQLFSAPVVARATLRAIDGSDLLRRNVARWLFEDYPRAMVVSPRGWMALSRRTPGAFADPDRS